MVTVGTASGSPAIDLSFHEGGKRAVARCEELARAPFSDSSTGLTRPYLGPGWLASREQLATWMTEAGMAVRTDEATNLVGRYDGTDPAAPVLLIGSHLDSVNDAGCFDGPLGIMLGIELAALLHAARRRLPFPIEVIAFGDEEGSRFPAAMLTSRAVAGTLPDGALGVHDSHGVALADLLDTQAFPHAARAPDSVMAYLEAHIEQGPVLEARGLPVGTVTGIAAQLRFEIEVTGTAGHAGTTAMGLRRDAVAGVAEMILAVETIASADASDLVATVGVVQVPSGAANVIAGRVAFTLDVRSGNAGRRDRAADAILRQMRAIAERRDLGLALRKVHDLPASPCDAALMECMDAATAAIGQSSFRLVSGAGHDAMIMAALCPTAMLFIRCKGGISHNPAEHVDPADAAIALAVMSGFVDQLGASLVAA